jgi:hypothetical protein
MANRTMQQKRVKMRRERRAWAKSYSMPKYIVANRGVLGEYKQRAKGLGKDVSDLEWALDVARRGKEVLALPANLQEQKLFFTILDNCWHRTVCFFNSQHTCFVLSHTDKRRGVIKRSIEYASKDRALQVWHMSKVVWIEIKQSG